MNDLIRIHPSDMVAVALRPLTAGASIPISGADFSVTLREDIAMGHKVALRDIAAGEKVIKYGFPIGEATAGIPQGHHVHSHNLRTLLSSGLTYAYHPTNPTLPQQPPASFKGYPRTDGRAGIRNELWIIPTVGCVNDVAEALARRARSLTGGPIENVRAFTHPYGCSQLGDDQEHTRTIIANFATHPNAGGVLVLGLGCENSGVEEIKKRMGAYDTERVRFLISQDVEDELEEGFRLLEDLAERMRKDVRVPCDASRLVVGLKCGGSDGLSGITANPAVGRFSDRLIALGGSTVLTEVPEMFGAENILFDRCESREVFDRAVGMVEGFKHYYVSHGQVVYENPSPGNKAGGITTLEDKSCGCVQKGGCAQITDVLAYVVAVT
ncbi:MAG: altronate dehydratase [Fretibacterium sp.]|nr:altronate dehydratase [Fretibacterium sp.]